MSKRYTDPVRTVAEVEVVGHGSDTLRLECGHRISVNHKSKHPKRKRCHGCRAWND